MKIGVEHNSARPKYWYSEVLFDNETINKGRKIAIPPKRDVDFL